MGMGPRSNLLSKKIMVENLVTLSQINVKNVYAFVMIEYVYKAVKYNLH